MSEYDIKGLVGDTADQSQKYIEKRFTYLKLDIAEKLAKSGSYLLGFLLSSLFFFFVLLFFSSALAVYLASLINSMGWALLIVGAIWAALGAVGYRLREHFLGAPILRGILKVFFEDEDEDDDLEHNIKHHTTSEYHEQQRHKQAV